jgi:hypothetical protein
MKVMICAGGQMALLCEHCSQAPSATGHGWPGWGLEIASSLGRDAQSKRLKRSRA